MNYDIAIIGGGPGGYVAAIRAAQLGAKTLLIEKDAIGGTCLNRGCIPTKALIASVQKLHDVKNCAEFGVKADNASFDFAAVMARKDAVTKQLSGGVASLVKSNGVEMVKGSAILQKDKSIKVTCPEGEQIFTAGKIIIATGSSPLLPSIEGAKLDGVIDSDGLLQIKAVPQSMIVVGGGVVGMEFAVIFQALGCQVTVVEMMPSILSGMDKDIPVRLGVALRKQGIKMMTSCKVKKIEKTGDMLTVSVETAKGEDRLTAEKVLMSAGRRANVENIGLAELGIEYSNKGIAVDEKMQTNITGVYAIGDVTGQSMLAHSASFAGEIAAQNAMGANDSMNFANIPGCVFTMPEIASVGLTEQEAQQQGIDYAVSKFNFAGNGKAMAIGETDGFAKIIADKNDYNVLGVHIMGPHASDLIMEGAVAVTNKLTAKQLAHTVHPHPTLSEVMSECATGIFGDPIHQVKMNRR